MTAAATQGTTRRSSGSGKITTNDNVRCQLTAAPIFHSLGLGESSLGQRLADEQPILDNTHSLPFHQHFQIAMKRVLFTSLLFLFIGTEGLLAQAPNRQRRRALFEDLLKVVIDSQQERNIAPQQPGRPNLAPPELRPDWSRSHGPATTIMADCRKQFQTWENECGQLVVEMRQAESRLPRLRPLLADAMKILGGIKHIGGYTTKLPNHEPLVEPYCNLDADWRVLQYRVKQVRGIPDSCVSCLDKCNRCNDRICELFEVQPQINRRELGRCCAEMASHFQHLTQDVYYDMHSEPGGKKLYRDCQALQARINETVPLIQRGEYDTIVSTYQGCVSQWRTLKTKLIESPHERVRRHCHKIETCGNQARELLWLPNEFDYKYMSTVCGRLQRDVNQMFGHYTLKDVLALPNPGVLLTTARDFQTRCGAFQKCIAAEQSYDQMAVEYGLFMDKWNTLRPMLAECETPKIKRRLTECDDHIGAFSGVFGGGPVFDHHSMVQVCADLDQLCLRLDKVIQKRIDRKYDHQFHEAICSHAEKMRGSIHVLHEHAIANRRHDQHAAQDLKSALAHWNKLRPMIKKCKEKDRKALNQLRVQIEPLLVKLQVIYLG